MSTIASQGHLPDLLKCGLDTYIQRNSHLDTPELSVLYIDIIGFTRFEENYGTEACHGVLRVFSAVLAEALLKNPFPWAPLEGLQIWDDGFAVLLPHTIRNGSHSGMIHRFITAVEGALNERLGSFGFSHLRLRYGLASASGVARVSTSSPSSATPYQQADAEALRERLYQLITQAGRLARRHPAPPPLSIVEAMDYIRETKDVRIHYQPIRNLATATAIGWESLARGPIGSALEQPLALFHYAEQMGCLLDVELICRNAAIRSAKVAPDRKLFINISPNILMDPSFRAGETRTVIEEMGLRPEQVVFEITEHHAINEYSRFLRLIDHYRTQGYQIAIDDVGAGHSGLVTLVQVKPDFIKIDMELIRGIEADQTKQDIVRAIQQISTGFHAKVVAEGIETAAELNCLISCGIEYGQGYLLGKPAPQFEEPVL